MTFPVTANISNKSGIMGSAKPTHTPEYCLEAMATRQRPLIEVSCSIEHGKAGPESISVPTPSIRYSVQNRKGKSDFYRSQD